jgi:nucleoside-diphosphate-sugar epimerase
MAERLIVGCGYLGRRVAERWLAAGDRVHVVTRSAAKAEEVREAGFTPIVADITKPESVPQLPPVKTLLFAVGYDRGSDQSIEDVYAPGLANALARRSPETQRVIYISTTGVYGSALGDWIDETTPPSPQRAGGRASLAAEQILESSEVEGVALRLAGIYGPDRIPFRKELEAGEPITAIETGWLNLIHVNDAATIVLAAAEHPAPAPVYCVSDGSPVVRGDYYCEVARLLGAPPPQFVVPAADSPRAARAAADKRVSNAKLLRDLASQLVYPNYRAGLAAILEKSALPE